MKKVLVVDVTGDIFPLIADLQLPAAMWSIRRPPDGSEMEHFDLVIVGASDAVDWDVVAKVSSYGPTIIVTAAYQRNEAIAALRRDLVGYVDVRMRRDALVRTLIGVLLHDEAAFARDTLGASVREKRQAGRTAHVGSQLTRRQHQIVTLIATGATDKEIAQKLGIASTTAQKHVGAILARLRVPNRAAAAVAILKAQRSAM